MDISIRSQLSTVRDREDGDPCEFFVRDCETDDNRSRPFVVYLLSAPAQDVPRQFHLPPFHMDSEADTLIDTCTLGGSSHFYLHQSNGRWRTLHHARPLILGVQVLAGLRDGRHLDPFCTAVACRLLVPDQPIASCTARSAEKSPVLIRTGPILQMG